MPIEQRGGDTARESNAQTYEDSPGQSPGQQNEPPNSANADSSNDDPVAIRLEKSMRVAEWWLIGIGIATLLVNIGIAKIYYGQLQEMREATRLTGAAVKIAGDTLTATQQANAQQRLDNLAAASDAKTLADRSATQSAKSLQATVDNFHQDQRAWVGIAGNGHIDGSIAEGSPFKVHIDFQNFGKSPAFNERGIAKILTHPITVPLPSFDTYGIAEASAPITLMPGVSVGITIETSTPSAEGNVMIMDKPTIEAINSGTLEVYLYGSQWYDDAFKKPHRTDFCLLYAPHTHGWGSCDRHNYAN
jgi:hypothetical protein